MKACYPLSRNGLKLVFFFFPCRGLNLTCVVLSISVVFVVMQWPTSTNLKLSYNELHPTLIPLAWVVHVKVLNLRKSAKQNIETIDIEDKFIQPIKEKIAAQLLQVRLIYASYSTMWNLNNYCNICKVDMWFQFLCFSIVFWEFMLWSSQTKISHSKCLSCMKEIWKQ